MRRNARGEAAPADDKRRPARQARPLASATASRVAPQVPASRRSRPDRRISCRTRHDRARPSPATWWRVPYEGEAYGPHIGEPCLCGFLIATPPRAQQSASSGIVGQATDSTQAALPGVAVTVVNVATNAQRTTVTDAEGRFSIQNLLAATYQIKARLDGFAEVLLEPFPLRFGEVARRTITMGVASLAEAVTVQAEAPLLQSQSASVGQVITEKQLEELPVADRNVLNLVATSAGVSAKSFIRGALDYGRRDQYVTVDGGRDSDTSYAADGIFLGSLLFNNMALNPPSDSLQEASLQRSSFSTEFGQGQAVVSMVTKSGSNRFSAAAFENFRHHA